LYLFASTVDQSLKNYFHPIIYLKLFFAAILLLDILVRRLWIFRIREKSSRYLFVTLAASFVLVSLISFLLNMGNAVSAFQFETSIFRPLIVFFWVVSSRRYTRIKDFAILLMLFTIAIQIPFYITGILKHGVGYFGDPAVGTGLNGDALDLGLLFWMGTVYYVFVGIYKGKWRYFLLAVGCLILLAITSTKQMYLVLPVCIILTLLFFRKLSVKTSLAVLFFFAIAAGAYVYSEENFMGENKSTVNTNFMALLAASEKYEGYVQLFTRLPNQIPVPFLGAGPGQYSSYAAQQAKTPLAVKYITSYAKLVPYGTRGMLTDRSSGVITFIGETGWLGFLLFFGIYVEALKNTREMYFSDTSVENAVICSLVFSIGISLFTQSLFYDIFETNQFMLNLFWVLAGTIVGGHLFANGRKTSSVTLAN
jgi:hypothetical protein